MQSNFEVQDFLKLSKENQRRAISEGIHIYEKYDGVKISVVVDDGKIIPSYKGFKIFSFENDQTDIVNSYGYTQFAKLWEIFESDQFKEVIRCFDHYTYTELIFEYIIRKPTLTTDYEDYHKLFLIGGRSINGYSDENGIVSIDTDSLFEPVFDSTSFCPYYLGEFNPIYADTLKTIGFNIDSSLGGKAEGIVFYSNYNDMVYRIVDPAKRTKEYRRERAAKYYFSDKNDQEEYNRLIKEDAMCVINSTEITNFEDTLWAAYQTLQQINFEYYCRTESKKEVNIRDDVYLEIRKYLIDYFQNHEEKEQERSPSLFIIRGLPGSGKSTFAKELINKSVNFIQHLEADMFFTADDGTYNFDAKKAHLAHQWCLMYTIACLERGQSVIVSNTFTTWKEIWPYLDYCIDNSIKVDIIDTNGEHKSIHGVPDEVIQRMKDRWMPIEKIKEIYNILKGD